MNKKVFKTVLEILLGLFLSRVSSCCGVAVSCMMVYDEGGAPAVFESPECPDWVISEEYLRNRTANCRFATLQGHREYQEDRVSCDLDMKISFLGENGIKEIPVGVVAVFDGHGGKEASEMASKLVLDYFRLHVVFNTYKRMLLYNEEQDKVCRVHSEYEPEQHDINPGSSDVALSRIGKSIKLEILREALLRTIQDIDLKFSQEAIKNSFTSGSTAVVVLIVDGQILVANVGDSKALLCATAKATELTKDHHPDRDDERARIEAAGGFVSVWGVPRVNGVLAMSRSIGDLYLKSKRIVLKRKGSHFGAQSRVLYGVIATPEVTGWRTLTAIDRHLVVASDGISESLTSQGVCDLIRASESNENSKLSSSCLSSSSLAECIVDTAFEEGSMDNLSAIVVPTRLAGDSQNS